MSFTENLILFLKKKSFHPQNKKILLAISGGMDSMCLLHFWSTVGKKIFNNEIFIAHLNHGLRKESNHEASFISSFCEKNNLPLFYKILNFKKNSKKESMEEWGREQRYAYFSKIQQEHNIDYTFTAHHLHDQWETLLLNIWRGTGLKGFQGIHFQNKYHCIRPFLNCTKSDLLQYAKHNKLLWFEDSTNQNPRFLRNWIRQTYPPTLENLQHTSYITQNTQILWSNLEKMFQDNIEKKNGIEHISNHNMKLWFSSNPSLYFHDLQYFFQKQNLSLRSSHLDEMIRQYKISPYLIQVQINPYFIFKWKKGAGAHFIKIEKKTIKN